MKKLKVIDLEPGLYLVATPIGNLRDITQRAIDVLKDVDIVLCEDTRVTGQLFKTYDITTSKISYNDHNASHRRPEILEKLANGAKVALVSDAGMPLVSDPGYKLVSECIDLGFNISTIPGANAPLSALQLSGLPTDKFVFLGFLPSKEVARKKTLEEWKNITCSLIAFETGPRLIASLKSISEVMGDRRVAVARELTKRYETVLRDTTLNLIKQYEQMGNPKGEIVLVIEGAKKEILDDNAIERLVIEALETMSVKEAANSLSDALDIPRKKLYEIALKVAKP
jgi:16S rRNA (cytidine1402-2'-O)-methyltransferase